MRTQQSRAIGILIVMLFSLISWAIAAEQPLTVSRHDFGPIPKSLQGAFAPPEELAGEFGTYDSLLEFYDGRKVESPYQWPARRREILEQWHGLMGEWPPPIEHPKVEYFEEKRRDDFTQHKVKVEILPGDWTIDGYLLKPDGEGPFPAVVTVYYEPETAIGDGRELRDFAYQLARRGFVALSIGTGASVYYPSKENATLQPLSAMAYAAASCHRALTDLDYVDGARIGVVGHSYGGKWAMFAGALYDKFALVAASDPGIVFDETRPNVNYWEPWYLGYDRDFDRPRGVPNAERPRTGPYRTMIETGRDLHELHALIAPRPFLVSGGAEDRPERWEALNRLVEVNEFLGYSNRVAMTNREGHTPTAESNEQLYAFFEYFLKPGNGAPAKPTGMVFPGDEWQVASPESQGVNGEKLQAAMDYLKKNSGSDGVREALVVRNGYLIWKGDNIDKQHGVWSLTKSFTSTCFGLLVEDGKVAVDTRAAEFVPALAHDYSKVTLRHFTTMTSGYRAEGDEPRGGYVHGPSLTPFKPSPDPLFPPGAMYAYWDSAMNEFAHVLTQAAGEPLEELFKRRIADPIGMNREKWDWGDFGEVEGIVVNGGSGNNNKHMTISARELARLGHLFLNRGKWNGKQLISPEWIDRATTAHVAASLPLHERSGADGRGVYGFNWWVNGVRANGERKWPGVPTSAYAASGYNNNDMFIVPDWDMVVLRLGLDQRDKAIGDSTYARFLEMIGEAISEKPSE